jgi:hypothetical protein
MDHFELTHAISAVVGGILLFLWRIMATVNAIAVKQAASDVRIAELASKGSTVWEFLMRRALSSTIMEGGATMNSPVVFDPKYDPLKKLFEPMAEQLRLFYKGLKPMKDTEAMLAIEGQFGSRITSEICIPEKVANGVCLFVALEVAKRAPVYVDLASH